jgi:hypothetical protein
MSTKYVDGFENYLTTITPMPGTTATLEQIAQDAQGWEGAIEVAAKSVRIKTRHLPVETIEEPDDCKLTTIPGLTELESEPVLDDVDHLDEGDGRPLADQLADLLVLDTPVEDEVQKDEPVTSGAVAPESTRGRTNRINAAAGPHAGITNSRRIANASVHTLVSRVGEVDEVVAAVLELGWAGMGAEVDGATTAFMGQENAGVKVRVRVPDVDEAGQPLCRFDEVVEAAPVEEPVAMLEPLQIDVPEGYRVRTGSSNGVWWIDLFRETGEVEDEVHVGTRRHVPRAEVQAVVDEMVKVAEEAYLAELTAEVELYKSAKVDEPAPVVEEVVHPSDDADQQENEDLDEELVDEDQDDELVQDQEKIDNADRDAVFGLPLEPDYVPDPTQGLSVLGVDHVVTVDELVPGQAIERIVHANANKVRTLAPCCGRYVLLPVTAGLYAPVACGWSCRTQYLVTRLYTDAQRVDSIARFVVLGPVLVVSQYYPGRGKKAS